MRTYFRGILTAAALAAACSYSPASAQVYSAGGDFGDADWGGGKEQRALLTINADGTSVFTSVNVESRAAAEQRVRMQERFQKMRESAESDDQAPAQPPVTGTNNAQPFTDAELYQKLTNSIPENDDNPDQKITVVVKKDDVVTTTTRSFASLEEMLSNSYLVWIRSGMFFENARFETASNGLLRVTFTPQKNTERAFKAYRSTWKLTGAKIELKFVFPGKVVSSGFPAMQTNATWIAVDAKDDASLEALAKLYAGPVVITAELGGLKLEQPLESKKLWRSRGSSADDTNLPPIVEAGPGYMAEAQSITTTTLHVFPGGESYFEDNPPGTGAVVAVKFFAPKGRALQSVSDIRITSAVDNKGRPVLPEAIDEDSGENSATLSSGSGDDSSAGKSVKVELRLQLPQPDAQSIDKISAQAIALTVGDWKEMTLTNLQANATNELDLSAVLPGARLTIAKIVAKEHQFNVQATLKGPAEVKRLEVNAKIPENEQFRSYSYERGSRTKNGQTIRPLTIQGYGFTAEDSPSTNSLVLVVRCPQDLRRERVKFELKALDLF